MSKFIILFLSVYLALSLAQEEGGESPIVQAPIGKVRGSIFKTILGRTIYAYRGVRYAEPPVGERRFKVATPAANWNGVFDGREEGPACITLSNTTISEDCLRVNVYTTKLPTQNAKGGNFQGRPVMVYFFPGGFYVFSAQSKFFGPEYLMDKDIVLVTVNHRMGALGYMSTGDALAPGNLGFKDQVEALRWVQRNIAAFGGNPNSVTLFGYSVGGTSVLSHLLSPMSSGLFHRAIAMSGSPIQPRPLPNDQREIAKQQAELFGCPTDTTAAMLTCMRTVPVENFTATMPTFIKPFENSYRVWSPVVEPDLPGVERFLPGQPDDLIRQGKINEVPLILGTTIEEFNGITSEIEDMFNQGDFSLLDNVNQNWETVAPRYFLYEEGTPRSRYISQELRRFYFNNQPVTRENYPILSDIYTDSASIFPVHRFGQLFAQHSRQPVYFYQFSYHGRYSLAMRNGTSPYGVIHIDDLQYLFYMQPYFPFLNVTSPEYPMMDRYTSMWTNFAQTGEPIPRNRDIFRNVVWERFVKEKDNYLDINLQPTMKRGVYPARMQLWDRLIPLRPLPPSTNC